ncbi:MAG: hypothetical protein L6R39_001533 [Caloplaca ligustica]|nr:MAG: hypothetical protein L6R39_001533 [Caloplaca ligustica]
MEQMKKKRGRGNKSMVDKVTSLRRNSSYGPELAGLDVTIKAFWKRVCNTWQKIIANLVRSRPISSRWERKQGAHKIMVGEAVLSEFLDRDLGLSRWEDIGCHDRGLR